MKAFEEEREVLLDAIASLYARGGIDEERMSGAIAAVTRARGMEELEAEIGALPELAAPGLGALLPGRGAGPQVLESRSSTLRKSEDWLSSRLIELRGLSSSYRLDLRYYAGFGQGRGLELELLLSLQSSTLRLILPPDFQVRNEIGSQTSSVVRIARRGRGPSASLIILRGEILSSSVRVVYRR